MTEPKLKPEVKEKWLEALRSGLYQQTISFLHTKKGFCCLGVLCDISKQGEWKSSSIFELYYFGSTESRTMPPTDVLEWAFQDSDFHEPTIIELAEMNDNGKSFEQIADHIEKNL